MDLAQLPRQPVASLSRPPPLLPPRRRTDHRPSGQSSSPRFIHRDIRRRQRVLQRRRLHRHRRPIFLTLPSPLPPSPVSIMHTRYCYKVNCSNRTLIDDVIFISKSTQDVFGSSSHLGDPYNSLHNFQASQVRKLVPF